MPRSSSTPAAARLLFLLSAAGSLLPAGAAAQDGLLRPMSHPLPDVRMGTTEWGDFDRDGDLDLFLSGQAPSPDQDVVYARLFRNDGDLLTITEEEEYIYFSRYVPFDIATDDVWQSAAAWGDYDRDGYLDVFATGVQADGAQPLTLYRNIGGWHAARETLFPQEGVRAGAVRAGDYDNDGDDDLFVIGITRDGYTARLYENVGMPGQIAFVSRDPGVEPLGHSDAAWADYDTDGDLDLVVTGTNAQQVHVTRLYRNDGGVFAPVAAGLAAAFFGSVAWGDYDADGDPDLLVSGGHLSPYVLEGRARVYRNDAGTFVDLGFTIPVGYHGEAGWGDYDNDGDLDLLLSGGAHPTGGRRTTIYGNEGGDRFTEYYSRFAGTLYSTAAWGDYDRDGDLDILNTGEVEFLNTGEADQTVAATSQYRNELTTVNAPPAPPEGLSATVGDGMVTLVWAPAADAETPAAGLTYAVRVGTTPGGVDVRTPLAVPESGLRLLSGPGHATTWRLQGLRPGTYYWSVQSIDNSYQGSAFAEEQTFVIP